MSDGRLILASGSPRRRELLSRIGIDVEVIPASVDETPREGEKPRAFAQRMAAEKAVAVAERMPGRWVLAADTVVALGQAILGKPRDEAEARGMLEQLAGKSHEVITAFAIIGPRDATRGGGNRRDLQSTPGDVRVERAVGAEVWMRAPAADELDGYLAAGEWRGKAGAYAVQGMAAAFVTEVRGSVTAVIGLPLAEVSVALAEVGCVRPDFRRGDPA